MAITKEVVLDRVEIPESLIIHLRYATYFVEDGTRVSEPMYSRMTIAPGDSTTERDPRVVKAVELHTPTVIAAYRQKQADQRKSLISGSPL